MALGISKELGGGIVATYARVMDFHVDWTQKSSSVTVCYYLDAEQRDVEKSDPAISTEIGHRSGHDISSVVDFENDPDGLPTRKTIYNYLKTLEEFEVATDV